MTSSVMPSSSSILSYFGCSLPHEHSIGLFLRNNLRVSCKRDFRLCKLKLDAEHCKLITGSTQGVEEQRTKKVRSCLQLFINCLCAKQRNIRKIGFEFDSEP